MTSDAFTADLSEPQRLFCYRHPDRETWVRCGRCDQPICMSCAMQGPVGLRCKSCGTPVRDALTSMTPTQTVVTPLLATGAGLLVGYLALQFGWFGLVVAFFAGRLTVDVLDRAIGMKRGPRVLALIAIGLLVGATAGGGFAIWTSWQQMQAIAEESGFPFDVYLMDMIPQVLIAGGVAAAGAWMHLRLR
jgi:hypothetical protein